MLAYPSNGENVEGIELAEDIPEASLNMPEMILFKPSTPTANPTKLAIIIISKFPTVPIPHSTLYAVRLFSHLFRGNNIPAITSGNMKNTTSQPQTNKFRLMSCHNATNVKTST